MIPHRLLRAAAAAGARMPPAVNRRWPVLKRIKRAVVERLWIEKVDVGGHTVFLDPTDSLRLGAGQVHEEAICKVIEGVLSPGDRVIDAGAHIGLTSLGMARAVGPQGEVHAFEPDPGNFALLRKNARANGYANIHPVQAAVWSAAGRGRLFLRDDHHADHRMWDPGDGRPHVEVDTLRLDDHFRADQPPVKLVKMDVQGSELHALRGMEELLRRQRQLVLVMEFWPRGLRGCGHEPAELLSALASLGFTLQRFVGRRGLKASVDPGSLMRELCPGTIAGRFVAAFRGREDTDLLAVKG